MEPVTFGKKRALLVKPVINNSFSHKKFNRHDEIIDKLRDFTSIRIWEKEENKWSYETFQKMEQTPYLIRPIPEKRNN